jgi:regulator of replication initiation timing
VDIFESGGLTKAEYMVRRRELDTQIGKVEQEIEDLKQKTARSVERKEMLIKFEHLVGEISDWITNDDPLAVNTTLKVLLANFTVDGE